MRAGARHFNSKNGHTVLVLRGREVYHTYRAQELWTLDDIDSLNELPPF